MTTEQLERLEQIREGRYNRSVSELNARELSAFKDIDFLLSLLDSQAAGGDLRVLGEIRQRVADGYESASSRNVITVAALTLKDLHYVLSSHDGQYARGATTMRSRCVAAVRSLRHKSEPDDSRWNVALYHAETKLKAVTLEQQEKQ